MLRFSSCLDYSSCRAAAARFVWYPGLFHPRRVLPCRAVLWRVLLHPDLCGLVCVGRVTDAALLLLGTGRARGARAFDSISSPRRSPVSNVHKLRAACQKHGRRDRDEQDEKSSKQRAKRGASPRKRAALRRCGRSTQKIRPFV